MSAQNVNEVKRRSFVVIGLPSDELWWQSEEARGQRDFMVVNHILRVLRINDNIVRDDVRPLLSGPLGQRTLFVTLSSIKLRDELLRRAFRLRGKKATSNVRLYAAQVLYNIPEHDEV